MAKNGTNKNNTNPLPNTGRKSLEEIKRELQSARPVYEDSQGRLTPVEEPAPQPPSEPPKFPNFQGRATSPSKPVRPKANEALIPTQRSPLAGRRPALQTDQAAFADQRQNPGPSRPAAPPPFAPLTSDPPASTPTPSPSGSQSANFGPGGPIHESARPYNGPSNPPGAPQYQASNFTYQPAVPEPQYQFAPGLNEPSAQSHGSFNPPPASSNEMPPLNGNPTAPLSTDEVRRRLSEQTMAFRLPTDSTDLIEGEVVSPRLVGQTTEPFKVVQNQPRSQSTQSFNYHPAADSGNDPYQPQPLITPARPLRPVRATSFRWPARPALLLGGLAALAVLVIVVVVVIALSASKKEVTVADNPTATAPAIATTAAVTTGTAQTTAAPATTTAAVTTAPITTASVNAQALADAKTATDKEDWPTVVKLLEPIDPNSQDFYQVRPMLLKAYEELGRKASRDPSNSEESANEAVSNYQKAQKLAPNNTQIKLLLNRAVRYQVGRYYVTHNQPEQALAPLRDLYAEVSALNPPQRYRDGAELLFNTLLNLGDQAAHKGDKASLEAARNFYTEASKVEVANKGLAAGRIKQIDDALNPATPTPAPAPQSGGSGWVRPAPTATPAPAPTKPAQTAPKPTAVVNMPQMPGGGKPSPQTCGNPGQPNC